MGQFRAGVLFGKEVEELYKYANENQFAIPAVNIIGTSSVNAVLEAAAKVKSPVIVQLSHGGAQFYAGKGLSNENHQASIFGAISCAHHVNQVAELYGVSVILHTDHAARKLLPWIEGLIEASEKYYEVHKRPLFSSHMLDLSEDSLEENIQTCAKYFERMNKVQIGIEIELGITGGEEDGVDNSDVSQEKLYTDPKEVFYAYEQLKKIGSNFTVAASFGNVHGVYRPGNVKLAPKILRDSQEYIKGKIQIEKNPVNFVFHGGSGSRPEEIQEAISYGVIKMNLDTDLQWAFLSGVRDYVLEKKDYLMTQIGNPTGEDSPNKKFYDPRVWLREGEKVFVSRVQQAFENLNCLNRQV